MSASAKRKAEVQITDLDPGTDSSGDEENEQQKGGFYDKKWEKADANTLASRRLGPMFLIPSLRTCLYVHERTNLQRSSAFTPHALISLSLSLFLSFSA